MFLDSSISSMVGEGFYKLFVGIIDPVLYSLINPCYKIFDAVARIDIFGTSGGQSIYDTFAGNVYSILSVIMIFVFIYEFLMMLINPDGDAMKSGKSLVKDTLISIIAIILFPVIASYLSIFQRHVLQDNTIQNMILSDSDGNIALTSASYDSGDQMAVITLMAFAHPTDYSYSDFYNSNGQPYAPGEACGGAEVCVSTSEALYNWYYNGSDDLNSLFAIFEKAIDEGKINSSKSSYSHSETFTYEIIIASVGCIIIVWFLVSYAIDLGTRAIKLGVLEMIAPIPLILKIFPKTKKTFDSWFKMLYKTYLELFVRIAIISITIKLCSIVPLVFQSLSDAITGIEYNSYVKGFAIMCVIIGLLKFAKDLPSLMKELGTGDLFAGMNLKPGVRGRLEPAAPLGNAIKGFNYGLSTGKGFNRFSGALRGFGTGLTKGYDKARSGIDDIRYANAHGSTPLLRAKDSFRRFMGFRTLQEKFDDENKFEYNGKTYNKEEFDKIVEKNSKIRELLKGINDNVGDNIKSADSEVLLSGFTDKSLDGKNYHDISSILETQKQYEMSIANEKFNTAMFRMQAAKDLGFTYQKYSDLTVAEQQAVEERASKYKDAQIKKSQEAISTDYLSKQRELEKIFKDARTEQVSYIIDAMQRGDVNVTNEKCKVSTQTKRDSYAKAQSLAKEFGIDFNTETVKTALDKANNDSYDISAAQANNAEKYRTDEYKSYKATSEYNGKNVSSDKKK